MLKIVRLVKKGTIVNAALCSAMFVAFGCARATAGTDAFFPPEATLSVCASAPLIASVSDISIDLNRIAGTLQNEDVSIEGGGTAVVTSVGKQRLINANTRLPRQCVSNRVVQRNLSPDGTVPRSSLLAFRLVMAYREAHPWPGPGSGAPLADAKTAAFVESRGRFATVSLSAEKDGSSLYPGCVGEEAYRVNLVTFSVLPYDGCLEPHRLFVPRLGSLPRE